jgi:hypothetical protein
MYKEIKNVRMIDIDASEKYPDSYILMRMDDYDSEMGTVLYVGDSEGELAGLLSGLENQLHCGIIEGLNNKLNSLGGVVASVEPNYMNLVMMTTGLNRAGC